MPTRRAEPLRSFDALKALRPGGNAPDEGAAADGAAASPRAASPAPRPVGAAASVPVYASEVGRLCPACRQALAACSCTAQREAARVAAAAAGGAVRVGRESKGRGGKTVTLVRGLALDDAALHALAQRLKTHCGAGGTVRDGVVEVQGDHVARVIERLTVEGFAPRRAGG